MIDNKLDSVKVDFIKYLDSLGISPKSHKNYRSDLNHFTAWAILRIKSFGSFVESLTESVPFLNSGLAGEYKNFMTVNNLPKASVNRRLSTLRHLSRYLVLSQIIDTDFMTEIENVSSSKKVKSVTQPAIQAFRNYLETEKVSQSTIKNYLSDIKHFMSWLETANN